MITEWWTSLDLFMKVIWAVTLGASLVFVIQTIATFLGADTGDTGLDGGFDMDVDVDVDTADGSFGTDAGMNLLTFRNFVNFCLGFGWSVVLLKDQISSTGLLMAIAVLVGIALVTIVLFLFKWLGTMQQSGNINVFRSAVGCTGRVYLTVPGARAGEGKVQITINNSVREYNALTDGETLKTGTAISVVEVIDSSTLLVEELNTLII